jgi:hypothetical protein
MNSKLSICSDCIKQGRCEWETEHKTICNHFDAGSPASGGINK